MKNSFLLYHDLEGQTSLLSDEQLGKLLRAIFRYEIARELPDFKKDGKEDGMLLMCFEFVKTSLDANRQKYEERCEKNRQNVNQRYKKDNSENKDNNYQNSQAQEESEYQNPDVLF